MDFQGLEVGMAVYEVRLLFDWFGPSLDSLHHGPCLWGMNEAAKTAYGYDGIERHLPLSDEIKARLAELSRLHNSSLDWNDPGGPRPWSTEELERFDVKARALLRDLQAELGEQYSVWYDPL